MNCLMMIGFTSFLNSSTVFFLCLFLYCPKRVVKMLLQKHVRSRWRQIIINEKKEEDILIIEVETKNHFLTNQDYWYFFAIFLTPRVSIKLGLDCVAFVIILFSSYSFSLSLDKMLKKKLKVRIIINLTYLFVWVKWLLFWESKSQISWHQWCHLIFKLQCYFGNFIFSVCQKCAQLLFLLSFFSCNCFFLIRVIIEIIISCF